MRSRRMPIVAALLGALVLLFLAGRAEAQVDDRFVEIDLTLLRSIENASVVPVRVSVVSSRALEGTLVVEGRNSRVDWEFPIAVAANSEVGRIVVAPVTFADLVLDASLVVGGEEVAQRDLRIFEEFGNENVAGLLGVSAPAESVELVPGGGRVTLLELDDLELLPALDTVVASPAGVRSLSPEELDRLLVWTSAGHQLVIADRPGTIDALLPDDWVSRRSTVVAGGGLIYYAGSGWADSLPPGLAAATSSFELVGFGGADQQELLADAGFGVLGLGMLAAILLAYLVIAGPVAFGVLRGMRQMTKAWVVLPALAVVFTMGVVLAGNVTTGGRGDGYASIVEVSPRGVAITESILIADEGRRTVELPPGTAVLASGTGIGRGAGSPVVLRPTRQSTDLVFDVDAGSGGTAVLARYTADYADLLTVEVAEASSDRVTGVVRNDSTATLEHLVVMVGPHLAELEALPAGEERPFTVDLGAPGRLNAPELRAWGVEGWFGFDGLDRDDPAVSDGPINASSWIDWRSNRLGTAVPLGVVTAVGWTRDLDVSLLGGTGRTALVGRAPITRVNGDTHPDLVRSFPGRLPPTGAFNEGPVAFADDRGPGRIHRFVRPETGETDSLAVQVNVSVIEVQVWTGGDWQAFDVSAAGRLTVAIEEDLWIDDVLWLRSVPNNVFDPSAQVVELTFGDADTLPGELMPPGVRSVRSEQFDFGGDAFPEPFGRAELGGRADIVLDEDGSFSGFGDLFRTYDVWAIELEEGQEVSVSMNAIPGGNLDPYLIVRGPSGEIRAENDDFRGLDSRVDFVVVESGIHEIETRPLGEFDQFGGYEVSITVDPSGAGG